MRVILVISEKTKNVGDLFESSLNILEGNVKENYDFGKWSE